MKQLYKKDEFDTLLSSGESFVIFKHSTSCSISGGACSIVEGMVHSLESDKVYKVHVIEERELSLYIAEKSGVKHESPQILVFSAGKIVDHQSHYAITKDFMTKILGSV